MFRRATEKCITFSAPIETKVEKNDKNRAKITKTISYRLQFVDSVIFIASSLSHLLYNLAEGVQTF